MRVYSEHCTQNIVDNGKRQCIQANLTTTLHSTMFVVDKLKGYILSQ